MHDVAYAAQIFDPTKVVSLHADADFVVRAQLEVFVKLLGQQTIDRMCASWCTLVKYTRRCCLLVTCSTSLLAASHCTCALTPLSPLPPA